MHIYCIGCGNRLESSANLPIVCSDCYFGPNSDALVRVVDRVAGRRAAAALAGVQTEPSAGEKTDRGVTIGEKICRRPSP